MRLETFIQHEVTRAEIYKLLADGFYPPDEAMCGNMKELYKKIGMYCPSEVPSFEAGGNNPLNCKDHMELKVDHARLFLGPYTLLAPPYGSVYLDAERRILGNSTVNVVNCYREAGLVVTKDFLNPPDHVAVELEFMHFLVVKEIGATNKENDIDFVSTLNRQQTFLDTHLCPWIFAFLDNVEMNAQASFYRYLARITKTFINYDYQTITSMASILQPGDCVSRNQESLHNHP